jgi:hypothetical protein
MKGEEKKAANKHNLLICEQEELFSGEAIFS